MDNFSHTFAICAYKESPYLEELIKSVINQSLKTQVIMTTSTPNDYIKGLADKYDIPLFVKTTPSDIRDDWNFAYNHAQTEWVTVAHQDDIYMEDYAKELKRRVEGDEKAIAFVSDYLPLKDGLAKGKRDKNSKIRRLLRIPLKSRALSGTRHFKRSILRFGNSICCPAVTYRKSVLGESFFTSDLKFNIDWDTFLKIAETPGRFLYVDKPLLFYRIHTSATSMDFIENNTRQIDDRAMFGKFWPEWMIGIIMHFYVKAYETYYK